MRFFQSLGEVPAGFGPSAVAIGKFDGVHAGHRRVISELRDVAARDSLQATIVTFDRHPLALLNPGSCPPPLVSNAQKVELLARAGVDATVMLAFDRAFSEQSPLEFVERILVDALHAKVVMVGADFRFGNRGSGTVDTLREFGQRFGFAVHVIDDVVEPESDSHNSRRASSTWIRELLAAGRVAEAALVLGHEPTVRGEVVMGAQRGRALGFPTANLSPRSEGFIPGDGVYAAWFTADGVRYGAAVSIGNNPTFDGVPEKQVEAHVLDETIDLYGKIVEVAFVEYIRGQVKYSTIEALIEQIADDETKVRAILGYPEKASTA
ncbi:bifunctional riboflavin kinase/FAD synthetase [Conyzicola nivalis]|uniref:Riboflavin biosynthesis protein n=1 Tax=Conyzicola nivalis TaxID=1477021 RepID=A0A916WFJ5_9MICO|nr:bifunctional riboflavin kinase/FAD synthetase [Conyzicola nivalis]GGA92742.1 riboflavin biosynthesis protein [Conyzicola nivalis]